AKAIKLIKDNFENGLAAILNLTRVSAPLFVRPKTGLNDNLTGVERPVSFEVIGMGGETIEIIHSLAKWKRMALQRYGFEYGEGLYTDMNAIRKDEVLDNTHSIYVDQWDWEKIILKEERTEETLKKVVNKIYKVFKDCEDLILKSYSHLHSLLPDEISFITAQDLEDRYPGLTAEQREDAIAKEKKAVFIMKIGGLLESGTRHDVRAPDYDDWDLNGDIIFWNPILQSAFEVSSMGIRVDEVSLKKQLAKMDSEEKSSLLFHRQVLEGKLPYTIGGGIGQSRMCMFLLHKAHIGEVHASVWPDDMAEACSNSGIELL
ncbi:MAG TPA: aspartate--ammonia ligase, partial [Bacillota bacterium]|nr:aspartate--ammonia ligase [Bacillota bacterium]